MRAKQVQRPNTKVSTTMRLPRDLVDAADRVAGEQGLSRTNFFVSVLDKAVRRSRARKTDHSGTSDVSETTTDDNIFG